MVTKQVVEMVNPFVKVMQNRVPDYKGICSLLSIKRPYNSKYSKDIFPRYIRYFINSKCLKISMKEYENINSNRYMSETRSKKCDHSIKILLDSTHLTFPAIIIALGYISKLRKNTITTSLLHHQNNSEVKILTLALMASMKAHYDNVYSNKSWSTVSGIPLRELNILESNFLRDINFDLYIDEKIFFDYMDRVENSLSEYYEAISDSATKEKSNTEDVESSNIPTKIDQNSEDFKRTSVTLTPAPSPRDKSEYEPKHNNDNESVSRKPSYDYLNVPDKKYMGRKSSSSSMSPSESFFKSNNSRIIESYRYQTTPSIYSTESFSSEMSDLNLPQYRDSHRIETRNSIQSFKNRNDQRNSYRSSDNESMRFEKDIKSKGRYSYLNRPDNRNDFGYSKQMNIYNNIKDNDFEQKSSIRSKQTKYYSSMPSYLQKYQQKYENGELFKDEDEIKNNNSETSHDILQNNETIHSSPIPISKSSSIHSSPVVHSSPVQIKKSTQSLRNNSAKDNSLFHEINQQHIPNRTSSNIVQQYIPKRTSSNNIPNRFSYNGYNNKMIPVIEAPENTSESNNGIRQSKSISIAYQTKPNQQMVDSSNQFFRHKTVSLSSYPAVNANGYPQGQIPVPYYPNQTPVQPVYPYYMDVIYPMKRSNTPQNSTQLGVIYDTNVVQPQIPHPPNPAMIQPQQINSGTIPSAIPSPISPQSITYSNGITIRQNSYRSNYSTPSPYAGSIIATPVNSLYIPENNIATPVHIISPPPIINPSLSQYSYSSQEYIDLNEGNYGKSLDNDNSSYDDSLYYHDIVDNPSPNENNDNIAKRSNTVGGSQNIRNELNAKNNGSNQYLHPNSYSNVNTVYGYDPIPRSNSCNYDYPNSNSYDGGINHSYSYDNNMRKNYPNDIYRNGSYDSLNRNNGYFDPNINFGYMSSSFPIVYKSSSLSLTSSQSSQVTDNSSYYNSGKRRSGFSNFFKKKSNNRFNDYLNESNKKSYRSNSINNKNYNNNDNNGPVNRSRSYSSSFRYNNFVNHSNSNNFSNYMKDKSKLNNMSTISNSEDTSFNKSSSTIKYTIKDDKADNNEQNTDDNTIDGNNEEITNTESDLINKDEDLKEAKNEESETNNESTSSKNEDEEIHDEKDKGDDINTGDSHSFNESVINDYIKESESESESEQSGYKNNEYEQSKEQIEQSETGKDELLQSQQSDFLEQTEKYDQNEHYEPTEKYEQSEHYEPTEQCDQSEHYEPTEQYNESEHYEPNEKIEHNENYEPTEQYEQSENFEQTEEYIPSEYYEQTEGETSEVNELPDKEGEVEVVYVQYNPEAYAKKMLDIENRRYSSISTYHLDNQSIISRTKKYRYSDCNFDSFIYDNSFHIESIKNELLDNHKTANTILSINSNDADADFERESYRNVENSYISSIVGTNDDRSESNINYYINHEDIDTVSYLGSVRSSIDEFYDRESLKDRESIKDRESVKDRRSERFSIRSRSDFINTSFSSIASNPISIDSHNRNHIIIDKNLPPPHRIIKKAIRTNSTPIYGTKTSPYMASKTSPYMSAKTSPYMSAKTSPNMAAKTSPYLTSKASPLIGEEERSRRRYSTFSSLSNISTAKSEDKLSPLPESKPMDKVTTIVAPRQEPKIIKVRSSKKSGIKKTMSLILESGSKIFTKKQSQNQNKTQNKNNNTKKTTYDDKDLPPLPSDRDFLEQAKAELKLTRKKHHSFIPSVTSKTESLLKLNKEASFSDISKLNRSSLSISNVESPSLTNRSPVTNVSNISNSNESNNNNAKSSSSRVSVVN